MEIRISNAKYSIIIDEESNISDTLDGIVAALQLEGFPSQVIYRGLSGKAESMVSEYGLSEGDN